MSRTGKKPVAPVQGVTVTIENGTVKAKGPKGEQSLTLMDIVNATQTDAGIVIEPANDTKEARAAWGTTRALIANMVAGVKTGFEKKLSIQGVGFRAALAGKDLKRSSIRRRRASPLPCRPRPRSL
jgi:large subunit ribosomal protein L6